MTPSRFACSVLLWTIILGPVYGQPTLPTVLRDVGYDQRVNEQVPLDLVFRDEAGRAVQLGETFHGRPVILVLAYYRCPMLCTEVLNGLVRTMLSMPLTAGKDFEVVTVSFDPRDTPEMATAKKRTYLERYGRPGAEAGWHFLTGSDESIKQLTTAVGFRYARDPHSDQFAHASGILVLTPTGRIFRYFLDTRFEARDVRLSLVQASDNKVGTITDQALLYCFHYDPVQGRYGVAIMNLVRVGGVLTVLTIAGLFVMLCRLGRAGPKVVDNGSGNVSGPVPPMQVP